MLEEAIESADEVGRDRADVEPARNDGCRDGVGEGGAGRLDERDNRAEALDRESCVL